VTEYTVLDDCKYIQQRSF